MEKIEMEKINLLEKIDFGNETGDDATIEELNTYFVKLKSFAEYLDINKKMAIITGKKGIGKSALLKWLGNQLEKKYKNSIVIYVRGSDLVRSNFKLEKDLHYPNEYIRDWQIRLSAIANRTLANKIDIPMTEDELSILESAEIEGFKRKNYALGLLERFTKLFCFI
jgi:predicted AAA+ superfamily ATPase